MSAQQKLSIESYGMIVRLLETRNFTSTASEFGVTQSAVTQKLQKFQDVWRVKFLERRGNEFVVTPEGQEFRARFRPLWDQFAAIDLRGARRDRVRVGISTAYLSNGMFQPLISGSEGQVDVIIDTDLAIRNLVIADRLDVAVTLLENVGLETVHVARLVVLRVGVENGVLLRLRDLGALAAVMGVIMTGQYRTVVELPDAGSILSLARAKLGTGLLLATDAVAQEIEGERVPHPVELTICARNEPRARRIGEKLSQSLVWTP